MDPLATNPLSVLTFIAAPAILTNASSVMALGTANRFARAIDRARSLAEQVKGKEQDKDPEMALRIRQLGFAERRALLLLRSLTAFYLSVGSFAAASLVSLLAAVFVVAHQDVLRMVFLVIALIAGVTGVGGLVTGSAYLIRETRMAFFILSEETKFRMDQFLRKSSTS